MSLGPGVRAVRVQSPYSLSRHRLAAGTTALKPDPLTLRTEAGRSPHIISFPADPVAFAVPDNGTAVGWLTHVDLVVLSGAVRLAYATADADRLFSAVLLEPGSYGIDLLLDDPIHGAHLLFLLGKPTGVTKVRILGFHCECLVDEESPAISEAPSTALTLTPRWSRFFGEPVEVPDRLRYFRFQRLTQPKPMRWGHDLEIVIEPGEQISQAVYVSGLYEPCTLAVLDRLLQPGDTFIDVGANIGLLTMSASRRVGPGGTVISLEPSGREFERLRQHIERNALSNVQAVQAAAGRQDGMATLHVADLQHAGLNTLEARFMYGDVREVCTETVPVMRIDDVVAARGVAKVNVLKVDVEGGEDDVIAGARATIERDRPALLLEVAGAASGPAHAGRLEIEALLRSLDYELIAIDGETGSLRRVADLTSMAENFLAVQPATLASLQQWLPHEGLQARPVGYDRPRMEPGVPYLSIILTGRNDDFGGDFNDRLFRALEFNHRHLTDRGIAHEFVFCEWRPVAGKPWLAEVLADRYPALVPDILTSYVADGRYHEAYSLNPKLQFQEFIAKNIGIRRCRGAYILTTNTDVYLSRGVLDVLEKGMLNPRVVYRVPRIDLKDDIDCEQMDWNILEDPRNADMVNEILPPLYTNASGDFLLLDRDSYQSLRGFNEVYRVAKVHMDSNFCLKAYSSGLTLTPIDAPVYHVGRGTLNSQVRLYAARPQDAPWGDRRWKRGVLYDNDPEWGLAQAPAQMVRPGIHFLDFSWDVVPPTVALKRVVLPAERTDMPSAVPSLLAPAIAPPTPAAEPPYPLSVTHREIPVEDLESPQADHQVFDDGLAVTINRARLDFLASLDLPLQGKRVLDAGCGVGHHTPFYSSRGCHVVGIDGRAENIELMKQLYPEVEGLVGDLQNMDLVDLGSFDVVHCFGLLYHLDSPVATLRRLASVCTGQLILETMVCDSKEPVMVLADEQLSANQALAGLACRPSPSFVAMALDRLGFPYVYGSTAPPTHPDFTFEWKDNRDIERNGQNLRCMFVASRTPVRCGHLVELMPSR